MAEPDPATLLEQQKLELERYKARLEYRKFVLGSVFAAVVIAALPPAFQLATALLEHVRKEAEREASQQKFREEYIKEFIKEGLNQDIELRIRFAEYFAFVSTDPYRSTWLAFHKKLVEDRANVRKRINELETDWRRKVGARDRAVIERSDEKETPAMKTARDLERESADIAIDELERNLEWTYKEVGYAERNRSVAPNPRSSIQLAWPAPAAAQSSSDYKVFVQFAGRIDRSNVKTMMEKLSGAGWKVEGVQKGGERTAAAAGYSEVRYADAAAATAAQNLAQEVQKFDISSRPLTIRLNPAISPSNLEVWISR